MAKKRDFPVPIHRFITVLNSFKGYWHDYDIFKDFINLTVAGLSWNGDPVLATECQNRYKDDFRLFNELVKAYIFTLHDNLHPSDGYCGWYDPLGDLYQTISSTSHCSFLEQFFTPQPICDMMTMVTLGGKSTHPKLKKTTVNDPACGSGRMLLSFNAFKPGCYLVGQDLDLICTKMTAINMAFHGIQGQALNMNTLSNQYFGGYEINPFIMKLAEPRPHIIPINEMESKLLFKQVQDTIIQPEHFKHKYEKIKGKVWEFAKGSKQKKISVL